MTMYGKLTDILLPAVCMLLFGGCGAPEHFRGTGEAEILFSGSVVKAVRTRASDDEPERDLISSENDYGDIHVHISLDGNEPEGYLTDCIYVTSRGGMAGVLVSKDSGLKLEWADTKSDHWFHAWTCPDGVSMDCGSIARGRVDFRPKDEDLDDKTQVNRKNNHDLEKLIALQKGPVSYRNNNSYVGLDFRHLVSKITITGVERTKMDSGTSWLGDVTISFPDMPCTGVFVTGVGDAPDGKPSVTADDSGETGLSFNATSKISDDQDKYHPFYLPPFTFEEYGEFIIEGFEWHPPVDGGEGWLEHCGPYYGHLADLPLDELKAGEHLALKLRVKDGQVFGVSTTILGWNENPGVTSGYSPKHKGIYNPDALRRFYDYCKALQEGREADISLIEDLITIETDADGNEIKVVRLYNDIDLKSYGVWFGWLDVPGDIVFDGMGHEIISFQDDVPFFTTGRDNIRDLYMDGRPYEEY